VISEKTLKTAFNNTGATQPSPDKLDGRLLTTPYPTTFMLEIIMKKNNMKLSALLIGGALTFASFFTYAAESHMTEALKHAEAATKATEGKATAEHATAAKAHATTANEHLTAAIKSLDDAIDHGKQGHADVAKKSAEEAVAHLKAAQ
jgi:hypothetical protein